MDLLKDAIKGISLTLFFLFIGIMTEFNWVFWLFVLTCVLKPFVDKLTPSINRLTEKLDNHIKNRPPQ